MDKLGLSETIVWLWRVSVVDRFEIDAPDGLAGGIR